MPVGTMCFFLPSAFILYIYYFTFRFAGIFSRYMTLCWLLIIYLIGGSGQRLGVPSRFVAIQVYLSRQSSPFRFLITFNERLDMHFWMVGCHGMPWWQCCCCCTSSCLFLCSHIRCEVYRSHLSSYRAYMYRQNLDACLQKLVWRGLTFELSLFVKTKFDPFWINPLCFDVPFNEYQTVIENPLSLSS